MPDKCLTFQSLLWWINYWRRTEAGTAVLWYTVSILVVVDQLLEAAVSVAVISAPWVSILVVVDQLLEEQ